MRQRLIFGGAGVLALLALATILFGGGETDDPTAGADREVEEGWDAEVAIQRSQIIAAALDDGVGRSMASCILGEVEESIDLDRVAGFDLSAATGSNATAAEADLLADALLKCGPSVGSQLAVAAPGAQAIPSSHAAEAQCLRDQFAEGLRESYKARFRGLNGDGPHDVDIMGPLESCAAAGAVILGASEEGLLEVAALSTLEWACLVERADPAHFERAFPFPDETGDALARIASRIEGDIAFCEAWVAGQDIVG